MTCLANLYSRELWLLFGRFRQALQEAVKQTKKSDADAKDICQSIKDLQQARKARFFQQHPML